MVKQEMLTTRKAVPRSTFLQILKERFSILILCENCKTRNFEIIHHIDGNPNNNNPSNLLLLCAACHGKEHSDYSIVYKDYRMKIGN
ncbi:MAG: HNH endonuclease [Nitrososphaeraceae archaeon]|jgi:HNH endonuclease